LGHIIILPNEIVDSWQLAVGRKHKIFKMKLIFFLIAFFLISVRYYFSWTGKDKERRGISESNMVIKSDNFYEEINYSGKFQLSDDESSFKSISPGGYFKFRLNDAKVKAQSDVRGEIEYTIFDGKNDLPLNDEGKILVTKAVKEMIYWGYDAEGRMERVYQKGGSQALLREMDSVKEDQVKILYLNRLFAADSLSTENIELIVKKVKSLNSDMSKAQFLNKITPSQFKNPFLANACFDIIKGMGSDMDKMNSIDHIIDKDSLSTENIVNILNLGNGLGSDMDKSNLYGKLIDKSLIKDSLFDSLSVLISKMGSDMDKVNLFNKMLGIDPITENQWIMLISQSESLGSDMDKANMLSEFAKKMPKTEPIKAAYVKAAKTIGNDNDYGRVMRALE
jgi:hypothetical protein